MPLLFILHHCPCTEWPRPAPLPSVASRWSNHHTIVQCMWCHHRRVPPSPHILISSTLVGYTDGLYNCTYNVYPCISRRLPSGGHRYRHPAIIADATMMAHINVASAPARYVYDCMAYRFSSHHVHLLHIYTPSPLSFDGFEWCCRACRLPATQILHPHMHIPR